MTKRAVSYKAIIEKDNDVNQFNISERANVGELSSSDEVEIANNSKKWLAPAPVSSVDSDEKTEWWKEKNAEVDVFITKDADLLKQYYAMRHEIYCVENGWENYPSAENDFDHKGKIIVAVKDGKVVGGMRLLTSKWVEYFPNEIVGTEFTYKYFLSKFDLEADAVMGEISAFFVEKSNRDSTISTMMIEKALEEAKLQNCVYCIAIATPLLNRSHRKDAKRLGFKVQIYQYPWKPQKSQNYLASCPIVAFLNEHI
jgi:N-acyl-L-homoserine lactone synthetase